MSWDLTNARRAYPFVPGTVGRAGGAGLLALPPSVVTSARGVFAVSRVNRSNGTPYQSAQAAARLVSLTRSGGAGTTLTTVWEFTGLPGAAFTISADVPYETGGLVAYAASDGSADFRARVFRPSDLGLAPGASVVGAAGQAVLEPACVIGVCRVTRVTLENRTGARDPNRTGYGLAAGWHPATGSPVAFGGDVPLTAGANAVITITPAAVQFAGVPGAGSGGVCDVPPRNPGETPPVGATTLDGGTPCAGLLRRINGVPGPDVRLGGERGIVVSGGDPGEVVISVGQDGSSSC